MKPTAAGLACPQTRMPQPTDGNGEHSSPLAKVPVWADYSQQACRDKPGRNKPCQTASCLLNSAAMQQLLTKSNGWLRQVMTGLVAVLLLGLGLLAASGNVHQALHADPATAHAPCAVCLLAQGQLDTVGAVLSTLVSPATLVWSLSPYQTVAPQGFDYSVAFGRGPPASASSRQSVL